MTPFVYVLVERFDVDHDKIDRERVVGVFAELLDARAFMAARVNEFRAHFVPEDIAQAECSLGGLVRVSNRFRDEVEFTMYAPAPRGPQIRGYRIDQFRMHGAPE